MVLWGGADLITTRKFTQNISFAFDFQELLKYARKNDSQNKFAMPKNNTVISDSHFFKSLHKSTSLNAIKITLPEKDDETEVIHSCLREDALTIDSASLSFLLCHSAQQWFSSSQWQR